MKNLCLVLCALAAAAFGMSSSAMAQGPVKGVENIDTSVVFGQLVFFNYPNYYDVDHQKKLTFEGVLTNNDQEPAQLEVIFDWLGQDGKTKFSPSFFLDVPALESSPFSLDYTIDFCPERVSLDLRTNDAGPIGVKGTFTHECLVPEPGTIGMVACGVATLIAARARRKIAA